MNAKLLNRSESFDGLSPATKIAIADTLDELNIHVRRNLTGCPDTEIPAGLPILTLCEIVQSRQELEAEVLNRMILGLL